MAKLFSSKEYLFSSLPLVSGVFDDDDEELLSLIEAESFEEVLPPSGGAEQETQNNNAQANKITNNFFISTPLYFYPLIPIKANIATDERAYKPTISESAVLIDNLAVLLRKFTSSLSPAIQINSKPYAISGLT